MELNIRIKRKTWTRLGKLKKFPERASFDEVINYLLDKLDGVKQWKKV